MWLENLYLKNFRNISNLKLPLSQKINLLVGNNAQGKTNIIEAIYLLATTKSFRTNIDADLINWAAEEAQVRGNAAHNEIKILINKTMKKVSVNNQPKNRASVIGVFPVVLFSPESLDIVSGGPEKRRRFLDQTLSVTDKNYLYSLSRYFRAMKNRNKLLWLIKAGKPQDLLPWDKQIASLGSFIWERRLAFVGEINKLLKKTSEKIANATIRIDYAPFKEKVKDASEIKRLISLQLVKNKETDIEKMVTSFGPHRDDFKIVFETLKSDVLLEKDINIFGSRGEKRLATLALKLVELAFIKESFGTDPTLLLDDVLSEFDKINQEHILKALPKQQSIITATSETIFPEWILKESKIFKVNEGTVEVKV